MSEKTTLYNKYNDRPYEHYYDVTQPFDKERFYLGYRYPVQNPPPNTTNITSIIARHHPYTPDSVEIQDGFMQIYLDADLMVHTYLTRAHFNTGKLTKMKLGKFLTNILKWGDQVAIKNMTDRFKPMEIFKANNAEEIRWVYDNSEVHCDSCMSGKFEGWKNHPVEVYDTPDFSLYYTLDDDKNVTNRCLVAHKNGENFPVRYYGNAVDVFAHNLRIHANLVPDNVTVTDEILSGLRLKTIVHDRKRGYILMPYLDVVKYSCEDSNGQIWTGSYCPNDLQRVNSWSYTQEGIVTGTFVECSLTGRRHLAAEMIKARHPSTGNYAYYHKEKIRVDPWGYADMRSSHPSLYRGGYPLNMWGSSFWCVINKRIELKSNVVEEAPGLFLRYPDIVTKFRRNFITGKLIPIHMAWATNDYRFFHKDEVMTMPDTFEAPDDWVEIQPYDDKLSEGLRYYVADTWVQWSAKILRQPATYAKLREIPGVETGYYFIRDAISTNLNIQRYNNLANMDMPDEEHQLYTAVNDAQTGDYYKYQHLKRDTESNEDIDLAAWGVDPNDPSTSEMRQTAEAALLASGLSLEDFGLGFEVSVPEASAASAA